MRTHINKKGVRLTLDDTINFRGKRFIIKRLYRDKFGVVKLETCDGVIFEADSFNTVKPHEEI